MSAFDAELRLLRQRVDCIDSQILALLNARAAVVRDIYDLKQRTGTPRLDRARTDAILDRLVAHNTGPLAPQDVRALFTPVLAYFVERYQPADPAGTSPDAPGS